MRYADYHRDKADSHFSNAVYHETMGWYLFFLIVLWEEYGENPDGLFPNT